LSTKQKGLTALVMNFKAVHLLSLYKKGKVCLSFVCNAYTSLQTNKLTQMQYAKKINKHNTSKQRYDAYKQGNTNLKLAND